MLTKNSGTENVIRITVDPTGTLEWYVTQEGTPGRLVVWDKTYPRILMDMRFPEGVEWSWWQEDSDLCIHIHEISAVQIGG